MSGSFIIGAVLFLGSVVLSQKLAVNGGARLDDATKLKIAEVFPKRNANYSIVIFAIVIFCLLALYVWPEHSLAILLIYASLFAIYIGAKLVLNVRKLQEIGAPQHYIRTVKVSFGVFIVGSVCAALAAIVGGRVLP